MGQDRHVGTVPTHSFWKRTKSQRGFRKSVQQQNGKSVQLNQWGIRKEKRQILTAQVQKNKNGTQVLPQTNRILKTRSLEQNGKNNSRHPSLVHGCSYVLAFLLKNGYQWKLFANGETHKRSPELSWKLPGRNIGVNNVALRTKKESRRLRSR